MGAVDVGSRMYSASHASFMCFSSRPPSRPAEYRFVSQQPLLLAALGLLGVAARKWRCEQCQWQRACRTRCCGGKDQSTKHAAQSTQQRIGEDPRSCLTGWATQLRTDAFRCSHIRDGGYVLERIGNARMTICAALSGNTAGGAYNDPTALAATSVT